MSMHNVNAQCQRWCTLTSIRTHQLACVDSADGAPVGVDDGLADGECGLGPGFVLGTLVGCDDGTEVGVDEGSEVGVDVG